MPPGATAAASAHWRFDARGAPPQPGARNARTARLGEGGWERESGALRASNVTPGVVIGRHTKSQFLPRRPSLVLFWGNRGERLEPRRVGRNVRVGGRPLHSWQRASSAFAREAARCLLVCARDGRTGGRALCAFRPPCRPPARRCTCRCHDDGCHWAQVTSRAPLAPCAAAPDTRSSRRRPLHHAPVCATHGCGPAPRSCAARGEGPPQGARPWPRAHTRAPRRALGPGPPRCPSSSVRCGSTAGGLVGHGCGGGARFRPLSGH